MNHKNNFDATRLVAASVVIYGHAHPLHQVADVGFLGNSVEAFAVKVFFVISGYLICASWQSDPNILRFLQRRILRIIPALVLTVLLTILVLGPAVTTLPAGTYLSSWGSWRYLWNILLYPIYDLPGIFADNLYPYAVNGSLWSLPAEFFMYLLLPAVLLLSALIRSKWVLVAFTVAFTLFALNYVRLNPPVAPAVFYGTSMVSLLDVAPYFLIGSCFYLFRDVLRPDAVVALLLVGLVLLLQPPGIYAELAMLLVAPYAILAFATADTPIVRDAGRFGDISYGLYLYGFPVQQTVYHCFHNNLGPVGNTLISLPIAAALAFISWHAVERRALAFKPRTPTPIPMAQPA